MKDNNTKAIESGKISKTISKQEAAAFKRAAEYLYENEIMQNNHEPTILKQ